MSLRLTPANLTQGQVYDYVIVGSGFGGSVSAMRLSEKGYKVLVIEKGSQHQATDFATSSWDLKRWMWMPWLGFRGIFKISPFKHVNAMSGVGVGGGSLTYGATLPTPKTRFFSTGSWAHLQDWESALAPHYQTALAMLGARPNPRFTDADYVIAQLAQALDKEEQFHPSRVGIFFDEQAKRSAVADPYFEGRGPQRKACIECGNCMVGCRQGAKNSLDKNYLYFANQLGADIVADHAVTDVLPIGSEAGQAGYLVSFKSSKPYGQRPSWVVRSKGVIFSAGVLGTIPLLMDLKRKQSLPNLSPRLGEAIRTNNETLVAVTSFDKDVNYAQGVCIGSILNTDEHSHLEPINFNDKSTLWRWILAPRAKGANVLMRAISVVKSFVSDPLNNLRVLFTRDWGKKSFLLMFMQHLDTTISFKQGRWGQLHSQANADTAPSGHIPQSDAVVAKVEEIIGGKASYTFMEIFTGAPSTSHMLGGATMGAHAEEGVVNDKGEVFGYHNMYVCDGSAVSANPGVNPSLSITALTEWCMSHIRHKHQAHTPSKSVDKIAEPAH